MEAPYYNRDHCVVEYPKIPLPDFCEGESTRRNPNTTESGYPRVVRSYRSQRRMPRRSERQKRRQGPHI